MELVNGKNFDIIKVGENIKPGELGRPCLVKNINPLLNPVVAPTMVSPTATADTYTQLMANVVPSTTAPAEEVQSFTSPEVMPQVNETPVMPITSEIPSEPVVNAFVPEQPIASMPVEPQSLPNETLASPSLPQETLNPNPYADQNDMFPWMLNPVNEQVQNTNVNELAPAIDDDFSVDIPNNPFATDFGPVEEVKPQFDSSNTSTPIGMAKEKLEGSNELQGKINESLKEVFAYIALLEEKNNVLEKENAQLVQMIQNNNSKLSSYSDELDSPRLI